MSVILDNFGRTLQKRKESATMNINIQRNYEITGGNKMSGTEIYGKCNGRAVPDSGSKDKESSGQHSGRCRDRQYWSIMKQQYRISPEWVKTAGAEVLLREKK